MTAYRHHSSRPPQCVLPRASGGSPTDRLRIYGPIKSMDARRSYWWRIAAALGCVAVFAWSVFA